MKRTLSFEFSRVTEAAALAAYSWLGRGNKNAADEAAVKAMRFMLNQMEIRGEVVIGEGEIDEAPMLYIGEKIGLSRLEDSENFKEFMFTMKTNEQELKQYLMTEKTPNAQHRV